MIQLHICGPMDLNDFTFCTAEANTEMEALTAESKGITLGSCSQPKIAST